MILNKISSVNDGDFARSVDLIGLRPLGKLQATIGETSSTIL